VDSTRLKRRALGRGTAQVKTSPMASGPVFLELPMDSVAQLPPCVVEFEGVRTLPQGRIGFWPAGTEAAKGLQAHELQVLLSAGNPAGTIWIVWLRATATRAAQPPRLPDRPPRRRAPCTAVARRP